MVTFGLFFSPPFFWWPKCGRASVPSHPCSIVIQWLTRECSSPCPLLFCADPTNNSVYSENKRNYDELNTEEVCYTASDGHNHCPPDGRQSEMLLKKLQKDSPFREKLPIKIGMQCILLKNINVDGGLCNGTRGVVTSFAPWSDYVDHVELEQMDAVEQFWLSLNPRIPVCHFAINAGASHTERAILPTSWASERKVSWQHSAKAWRAQLPITWAWAMTIHKSQGMTISRLEVHLSNAFAAGQAYVALSRATGFAGLELSAFDKSAIIADKDVLEFYSRHMSETIDPETEREVAFEKQETQDEALERREREARQQGAFVDLTLDSDDEDEAAAGPGSVTAVAAVPFKIKPEPGTGTGPVAPVQASPIKKKSPAAPPPAARQMAQRSTSSSSAYGMMLNRQGPQQLGSRGIPKGAADCLDGLKFVVTGVLETLERGQVAELIKKYGGKVMSNVGKTTDFVVLGREAGPKKLELIAKFKTKTINEDGFFAMIEGSVNAIAGEGEGDEGDGEDDGDDGDDGDDDDDGVSTGDDFELTQEFEAELCQHDRATSQPPDSAADDKAKPTRKTSTRRSKRPRR